MHVVFTYICAPGHRRCAGMILKEKKHNIILKQYVLVK